MFLNCFSMYADSIQWKQSISDFSVIFGARLRVRPNFGGSKSNLIDIEQSARANLVINI